MRLVALAMVALPALAQIPLPFGAESLSALATRARSGSAPDVRDQLEDAARRARAQGDPLSEAWARVGLAALFDWVQRPLLADSALREAVLAAGDREPRFRGRAALWLAREADRVARFQRLRHWAEIAVAEFRAVGDQRNLALALHLAAGAARGNERREFLDQALAAAVAGGDARDAAVIRADRGEALRAAGDLAGALRELEPASAALESMGAWPETCRALTLLARAHAAHGQRREALFHLNRAAGILAKAKAEAGTEELRVRVEMGNLLAVLGERTKALQNLDYVRLAVRGQEAIFLNGQSAAVWIHGYLALGDYEQVVTLVERIKQNLPRRIPTAALWMQSEALFRLGRYAESADAATESLRGSQPDALTRISAHRWRARSLDRMGRHEDAAKDALEAMRLAGPVLMKTAPDDEWKRAFAESREDIADDLIAVLWRAGSPEDALRVAERFRARAFLDLMASRGRESEKAPAPATSVEPRLSSAGFGEPVEVAKIAAYAAEKGTPLLSYWAHPDCLYLWLFTSKGEIRPVRVAVTKKRLADLVEQSRRMSFKPDRGAWRELHRLLVAPVEKWVARGPAASLAVLPHGPLQRLPFGALLSPAGRYLAEDYRLRTVPAAEFLLRERHEASGPLVLIGDPRNPLPDPAGRPLAPLPGARVELEKIGSAKGRSFVLVSGGAMREERVLKEAGRGGILHFATHAVVDEQRPFESFLALSERDKLTAGQVYRMRIPADLVTLSACRGGSGRVSSDGILGFPRAFLYAGAESVLAPLWDVPDETTSRLMQQFYRRLREGASKSEALRSAQVALLGDLRAGRILAPTPAGPMPLPEHPGLWAGFVLMGAD